jgi:hypothetical protein
MSDRLAISSAFSILLMASYVLLGGDATQVQLDEQTVRLPQMSTPAILPQVSALLPG